MSVRKRIWVSGGVTQSAWLTVYVDQWGKRRSKQFDRKKDAEAYELAARQQVKQGVHTADSQSMTISEAANSWLETVAANERERSTIRPYRNHVDLHIIPLLGDIKISRLTTPMIEQFKTDLQTNRSQAMARKVLSSLKMMLSDMQRRGKVGQNVALAVKIDGRRREKARVAIPTKAEVGLMLEQANPKGGFIRALVITALFTGLRSSELRGLAWSDIDFKKRLLTVKQRADQWGEIGSPKSAAGRRDVPLTPLVADALTTWKRACPTGELGLVFPNGTGKPESHSNIVNRMFNPLLLGAGVFDRSGKRVALEDGPGCRLEPKYSFHALRHFYASWIIEQAFIPKRVQELMGHSSMQMTYDTYGHLFPTPEEDYTKLARAEASLAAFLLHGEAGDARESSENGGNAGNHPEKEKAIRRSPLQT
ncbi:MAG: site-specific integrase [Aliidongia sp.]